MGPMPLIFIALPVLLAVACYTEIRLHRIPNLLTYAGIVLGLGAAALTGGWTGLEDSAIGLALAGCVFLPFCLMGVVGGGDMKLMAAVGAIVGWPLVLGVLCDIFLAGGLLAIGIMVWNGVFWTTLANAFRVLVGAPRRANGLRNPPMVPYGIAIAAGTLFAVFYKAF